MTLPTNPFTRLCNDDCVSAHKDHTRGHLPAVLMRATHEGNANGSIPPNNGPDLNGDIWPRYRGQRMITLWEVESHGEMKSSHPTQFSSFTTWRGLAYRIHNWKEKKVQNIRVHIIFTHLLSPITKVYAVTALRKHFRLEQRPYFDEEFLICGPVLSGAIVCSLSGDGEDVLWAIPLFGFRYAFPPINSDESLVMLPSGFLPGVSETNIRSVTRRLSEEVQNDIHRRVVLDAFTRGLFFTVANLEENSVIINWKGNRQFQNGLKKSLMSDYLQQYLVNAKSSN